MSFYNVIEKYKDIDIDKYLENVSNYDVLRSLEKDNLDEYDLLNLLSKKATKYLEEMAQKAHEITNRYFGKTILLYTPMYIANYCVNKCLYCGYNIDSGISRKKLNINEIKIEGNEISKEGFKHLLLLTGESKIHSDVEYIGEAVEVLKDKFPSITIEVYPMDEEEYKYLVDKGVEGLTVYQEVYDENIYKEVHLKGPKSNYKYRLDSPERGIKAGMRSVSIGSLLGLNDFRKETFFTLMHGRYLRKKYPHVDVSYSIPRIRTFKGCYEKIIDINDNDLVQAMVVMRLFDNQGGINLSTRESLSLRRNLIPLGVTKLSAGVSTNVGGHSQNSKDTSQFKISDESSVSDIKAMLKDIGYQQIFKDWERF
ncbi:2-iminoacetate synthase ThiH [Romboutsia sp. 1001216sp1]|uniref:2-iminoacetate synthase ThiH n=1 Tax=unclassified Romboutsia TaxID=2626894 RepID=UPI0018AAD3C3|nr:MULTISPECIES: 2-iminoacetate synthase ThiH [unclassified Romboutsia]MDB8793069.1 2-iminoacetate synthase ThiH [Romboutsia sp. 1001216sp1]MDB8795862.1 2-iminoacetate synthase ThiH [Romboutsia sp. 1001216sp1]MDB8799357.1 2-iminoacetate synthase ThiH [Romboutsia sp. 1001216sp1]